MEPLKLISSKATETLLAELARQHEAERGQPVQCEADGGKVVAPRVQAGAEVDVVVLDSDVIDSLMAQGSLVAGSRVDLASSRIGMAVRAGAPRPDISTEEAVRQAALAARSVSYSTGPSGKHLEKVFKGWGIPEERIVVAPAGIPVATLVQDGRAELGFQQLSELLGKPGIDFLGPLPAPLQKITIFSGAISTKSTRREAARALLEDMASRDRDAVRQRHGMDSP